MPSENKSEKPTPRRIQRAKEEGNVPKSMDVNSAAVLLSGFALLWLFGGKIFEGILTASFKGVETFISPQRLNSDDILLFWGETLKKTLLWLFLLLLVPFSVAIVANVAQFGVIFTTKP